VIDDGLGLVGVKRVGDVVPEYLELRRRVVPHCASGGRACRSVATLALVSTVLARHQTDIPTLSTGELMSKAEDGGREQDWLEQRTGGWGMLRVGDNLFALRHVSASKLALVTIEWGMVRIAAISPGMLASYFGGRWRENRA